MDPHEEERLVAIDVPGAGDDALVEKRVADRPAGAFPERVPDGVRIGVVAQRIGSEPREDRDALSLGDELAGGRTDQVDRDGRSGEPQADRRPRPGGLPLEAGEVAGHPEVNVDDPSAFPEVKEVLAVRVRSEKRSPIETPRFTREPPLRRPGAHDPSAEVPVVLPGETVNGVALGHARRRI
jgi:hypothetical protein